MTRHTRRDFLKTTLAAAATVTIAGTKASGRVLGANDTIRVGVAGLNGRGGSHVNAFSGMQNVEIAYLIDPDTRTFARHIRTIESRGGKTPKTVQDVRKALEDKDLDVISIATPNHWHALMTIWACQAGKDVYVEKPASHNIHEGRIAVETARKYKRIVQHGTQSRSGSFAMIPELVKSGRYGKLLVSRGLCYKDGGTGRNTRGNIGFAPPKAPPAELDFNIWLGPAPEQPYHENLVHYRWHWFWDFGNGDIGNQGVHEMDKARWAIPGATLPKSVISLGGRIGFKDQGQTACTQIAIMDFGETQLIFEVRGLKTKPYLGETIGNILHFEQGVVTGGRGGFMFHPKNGGKPEPVAKVEYKRGPTGGRGEDSHFSNFIAAVRSRKVEDLNADILEGHLSSALIHLANASYRLGDPVPFSPRTRALAGNPDAEDALIRMEEHLAKECNIKLDDWKLIVGRKLIVDASTERVTNVPEANQLLTRNYRKPFVVPDKVV
ncbi:MAG TPA: Gfo/Idh/MocA family oxidoreductase [Gemmataceae bacterium]|nr:Gfo/Idh/MocA family oxidoreductase [Gemmataceae bacterium]